MRRAILVAVVVLATPAPAPAAIRILDDGAGRTIAFDVRAARADVRWYARLLRNAVHGDEIEDVVVRIVPARRISAVCGGTATGCYEGGRRGGVITVPEGRSQDVAHTLLHEYAHHLEEQYSFEWWSSARGIERLVQRGAVSWDYRLGWRRSVSEILAEDYVRLHRRSRYLITWLAPPTRSVLAALRRDLSNPLPSWPHHRWHP